MTASDTVTLRDRDSMSPSQSPSGGKGRILYCRKCEGHGKQVILKGHAPACPYILCSCPSCDKLMNKRLKSFNKRNKEKIQMATRLAETRKASECDSGRGSSPSPSSGTSSPDTIMSTCTTSSSTQPGSSKSSTGLENRSMSLGAMTVMSYDIWKAKMAAERKSRDGVDKEEGSTDKSRSPEPLLPRKRAHTFVTLGDKQLPKIALSGKLQKENKGRYITLPTIPPMSVLISEDDEKELTPDEVPCKEIKREAPVHAPAPHRKASMPVAPTYSQMSKQPQFLPQLNQLPPLPTVMSTTISAPMPIQAPVSRPMPATLPTTVPTTMPAEQILASMLPSTTLPTSLLLQNSVFLQQQQQQQTLLNTLLNNELAAALLAQTVAPAPSISPDLMELLRTHQLQQLTQTLSGTTLDPASCGSVANSILSSFVQQQQPLLNPMNTL